MCIASEVRWRPVDGVRRDPGTGSGRPTWSNVNVVDIDFDLFDGDVLHGGPLKSYMAANKAAWGRACGRVDDVPLVVLLGDVLPSTKDLAAGGEEVDGIVQGLSRNVVADRHPRKIDTVVAAKIDLVVVVVARARRMA